MYCMGQSIGLDLSRIELFSENIHTNLRRFEWWPRRIFCLVSLTNVWIWIALLRLVSRLLFETSECYCTIPLRMHDVAAKQMQSSTECYNVHCWPTLLTFRNMRNKIAFFSLLNDFLRLFVHSDWYPRHTACYLEATNCAWRWRLRVFLDAPSNPSTEG
jgi:hypothetical protein